IEHVLGKLGGQLGELFLDRGVALLLLERQLGAAEAEVAQRVLDDLPAGRRKGAELRRACELLVLLEKLKILSELGPVLRDLGQGRVVSLAERRAVHHRAQMRDLAPGAAQALVRVLERRDEVFPGGACPRRRFDRGAAGGEQLVDGGSDVLRLDLVEPWQTGKLKKWIHSLVAARMQFSSSMAIVIGPTPPGTGVIQPATLLTASKSTSPASLPSDSRLMPTSMTQAPGLTISAPMSFGRPTAAIRRSALRHMPARSALFEWQMVTVASFCKSRWASGWPTMFERPTTTACRRATCTPACSMRRMQASGVPGTTPGRPAMSAPRLAS